MRLRVISRLLLSSKGCAAKCGMSAGRATLRRLPWRPQIQGREFAVITTHLGISMTRSLNIPARMVVGYLYRVEPMDLHAWFEAFIGGRRLTFDGTQQNPRGNRIAIGYGRDAADVALTSNYGALELKAMKVTVEIAS
jgi:transglutaminase-like putative cysteine protease